MAWEGIGEGLSSLGYNYVRQVKEKGDFSLRGDTLDIFASGFAYPVRIEWEWEEIKRISSFDLESGLFLEEHQNIIILPFLKKEKKHSLSEPLLGFLDIKESDYVVHVDYGIGIYRGLKKIERNKKVSEFLEIEYRNREKLYLRREKAYLLQKYVSLDKAKPRRSKLSSQEWKRTKAKAQKHIRQFALELVRSEAARRILGGFAFGEEKEWENEFARSFPYPETQDQKKAWQEVKKDMESSYPMDRLICGDVGYGKTEIALRAAFKAALNSKQVAFLVPTTILAQQHFENFKKRIEKYPLRVELLCRFRTQNEQKEVVEGLKSGRIDIVIGTQRLLSDDVSFKDLGLLIIDEEQRFGVRQKEKIKNMKIGIDVLMLTATPIPRTLYMSLGGIRAISLLKTPPRQRKAVKTFVQEFSRQVLKTAIEREINRGGQVYIIERYIRDVYRREKMLKGIFKTGLKLGLAHGALPPKSLQAVMHKFMHGDLNCLISTAIVESGIDIPLANTLIVSQADLFGMADLHQLRGRVGRFNRQAYAYFFFSGKKPLPSLAQRRLAAIKNYSYLGSGFDIAMKDLELRGAGNILGQEQHGFIWAVGLDLYCRMLRVEVAELRKKFKV